MQHSDLKGTKAAGMPKVRPGDFGRAAHILAALGNVNESKRVLADLVASEQRSIAARKSAVVAEQKAADREKAAVDLEAKATQATLLLADETTEASIDHKRRELEVSEREQKASEIGAAQVLKEKDLAKRETLLRKAGVKL